MEQDIKANMYYVVQQFNEFQRQLFPEFIFIAGTRRNEMGRTLVINYKIFGPAKEFHFIIITTTFKENLPKNDKHRNRDTFCQKLELFASQPYFFITATRNNDYHSF